VTLSLDEGGTAFCRAVRRGFAEPEVLEILDTNFQSTVAPGSNAVVNITSYDTHGEPLLLGTDYDVYCYAHDDLCHNCDVPSGITAQAVTRSKTEVRTLDETPPQIQLVARESISRDEIHITLRVDEGARVWCAAWASPPPSIAGSYESLIKGFAANCADTQSRACGSFWVYDFDDLEDSASDGVAAISDYNAAGTWTYNEDVEIVLSGLTEELEYSHIYCFAEDDEDDGVGSTPNIMVYSSPSAPAASQVLHVQTQLGSVTTLDESPPSFTTLAIDDPTAYETKIIVTFSLNEAGTAYCRATRVDSGESSDDLHVLKIISAGWSATYTGGTATIEMTRIENADPATVLHDAETTSIAPGVQYDVYCWAVDVAETTGGLPRPNFALHSYSSADVGSVSSPSGGRTAAVWVVDATPPTMTLLHVESINHETLQVILQLDEPGTLWCAAAELDGSSIATNCKESAVQDTEPDNSVTPCYYETFVKGSYAHSTTFRADVHAAYEAYTIAVDRIWLSDRTGSSVLRRETPYKIFCFAEDDWKIEADNATLNSLSFVSPSGPNMVPFNATEALVAQIGTQTTLDDTPPSFTKLEIEDPTAYDTMIIVTFRLNEAGTAYCRPLRSDSAAAASPMTINQIVNGQWSAANPGDGTTTSTIEITRMAQPDPALTTSDDETALVDDQQQYHVYCWAHDDAADSFGSPRLNYMIQGYVDAVVATPGAPEGGTTRSVWVVDDTAPTMIFVHAEAINDETIHLTLQLDEPGTIWCAAAELDGSAGATYCKDSEMQDTDLSVDPCYFEVQIKGGMADSTVFSAEVHEAYRDVHVEVDKIWGKSKSGSVPDVLFRRG